MKGSVPLVMAMLVSAAVAASLPEVKIYGALRPIMHEGKTEAVVQLSKLPITVHTVGLGAIAKLDGEVTILNGETYIVRPRSGAASLKVTKKPDVGVCLLAIADVERWTELKISVDITPDQIDKQLTAIFERHGLDTSKRIPFLLEGEFRGLEAHVVDGSKLPPGASSHEQHLSAGVSFKSKSVKGTIVGFYTTNDQGVITHMGSSTHMHCVLPEAKFSGHVDAVMIPAGTILKVPAQ